MPRQSYNLILSRSTLCGGFLQAGTDNILKADSDRRTSPREKTSALDVRVMSARCIPFPASSGAV